MISKPQLLMWCIGSLAPVLALVVDRVVEHSTSASISGGWLYASVLLGALVSAFAIASSRFSVGQRVALVFASWLLLVGEVLAIGVFLLLTDGLRGIQ